MDKKIIEKIEKLRALNIGYAIEVLDGRLNGSADEVERNKDSYNNTTFTKKIGNRGMVSSVCQKYNIRRFQEQVFGFEQNVKLKDDKQIKLLPNPYKFVSDDINGFMMAEKSEITKEAYNELSEEQQKLYKSAKGEKYVANITKKRVSRLQMSSLVNVSNRRINLDFHTCGSTTDAMPFKLETYAGVMGGIANLNIGEVGKFHISDIPTEYRDFGTEEAKILGVKNLNKEEKYNRIESVLRGIEYLSIKGNQSNNLTDTKPKFVIMAEYSWGNNVFQGVIGENGINIALLREAIEQNEAYRISDIWIGVNQFFDTTYNDTKDKLIKEFAKDSFVKIDNVHNTFNDYLEHLEKTL